MRHQGYLFFALILCVGLAASSGLRAQNPFGWQQDEYGRPFVAAPTTIARQKALSKPYFGVYSPTIYSVGSVELPSDAYNPNGSSRNNKPSMRGLGGYGAGDDPGQPDPGSPVGEPLALLLFAVLFAGAVAFRRAKQSPKAE